MSIGTTVVSINRWAGDSKDAKLVTESINNDNTYIRMINYT